MATPLHFGIADLDRLFTRRSIPGGEYGIEVENDERMSICVLGPDGCGKSILALHLASFYRARTQMEPSARVPHVVYFSSDLSYNRANRTWQDFGLDVPAERLRRLPPFAQSTPYHSFSQTFPATIKLQRLEPLDVDLAMALEKHSSSRGVVFIDSETQTTGDDWLYLQRLVSLLPDVPDGHDPHLLVIDAVEGLEPVPNGPDSFGEIRSGRTRIAQLIRAGKKKCHIVYVVEEPRAEERLDTQYVTDVVVRLRAVAHGSYSRRTIEIEKARGHQHVRGQHDIAIRKGAGSTTGRQENPDDPVVTLGNSLVRQVMAYVHVLRSIHSLSRELLVRKEGLNPQVNPDQTEVFGFGITHLDRLLPKSTTEGPPALAPGILRPNFGTHGSCSEARGLIGGSVNALIGPLTTYKSRLARAFLSRAIFQCVEAIQKQIADASQRPTLEEVRAVLGQGESQTRFAQDVISAVSKFLSAPSENPVPPLADAVMQKAIPREMRSPFVDILFVMCEHAEAVVFTFFSEELKTLLSTCQADAALLTSLTSLSAQITFQSLREEICESVKTHADALSITAIGSPETRDQITRRVTGRYLRSYLMLQPKETLQSELTCLKACNEFFTKMAPALASVSFWMRAAVFDLVRQEVRHKNLGEIEGDGALEQLFLTSARRAAADHCIDQMTGKDLKDGGGVAVLFTTLPIDAEVLLTECLVHLGFARSWIERLQHNAYGGIKADTVWERLISERVLCRRLEVHHLSSEGAVHLVSSVLRSAQRKTLQDISYRDCVDNRSSEATRLGCRRIRVVVDDWSLIKKAYPEAAEDFLLLPYVVHLFKREGVTALFVDTESGLPFSPPPNSDTQLRTLAASQHIYTWLVPFAGERRVAITTAPPTSASVPSAAYELKPSTFEGKGLRQDAFHNERLVVDPHFEMYSGLDLEERIERVPLRVKLYGNEGKYSREMKELLGQLFRPVDADGVLSVVDSEKYDLMRDYAYLQDNVRLDHTFVMQVDEFWSETQQSLYDLTDFVTAPIRDGSDPTVVEIEDPYRLHRFEARMSANAKKGRPERWCSFSTNEQCNDYEKYSRLGLLIDKHPYLWDFGFLLADRSIWLAALRAQRSVILASPGGGEFKVPLLGVWNALSPFDLQTGEVNTEYTRGIVTSVAKKTKVLTWPDLIHVSSTITPAGHQCFDVDFRTIEVLSCLILEIWLSFTQERINARSVHADWRQFGQIFESTFCGVRHVHSRLAMSLPEMLRQFEIMQLDLYYALCLVFLRIGSLETHNVDFVARQAGKNGTVCRHFYSTACDTSFNDGRLVPLRLPGRFCVRGDWFLAMAKGSRSPRLGERAIDLLCSTRANLARLQEGIGLPIRAIVDRDKTPIRTALVAPWRSDLTPDTHSERVMLSQLEGLAPACDDPDFRYIWRSGIRSYDLHSRAWLRWMARVWQMRNLWLSDLSYPVTNWPSDDPIGGPFEIERGELAEKFRAFKKDGLGSLMSSLERIST